MSLESATRFLSAVSQDELLREKFETAADPRDFLHISQQLGYSFTTEELMEVVKAQSQGVVVRRNTGVWKWLRHINWV